MDCFVVFKENWILNRIAGERMILEKSPQNIVEIEVALSKVDLEKRAAWRRNNQLIDFSDSLSERIARLKKILRVSLAHQSSINNLKFNISSSSSSVQKS
jgi:hypothetical protein